MKHFFLISVFLLFQNILFAHNSQQATLTLRVFKSSSLLEMNVSQYGIEQALTKKYPNLDLKSIESNKFQEILINYVKENVFLSANGKPLKIGTAGVKLGSHQTLLQFKVTNFPKQLKYIDVDAHCFKENEKQQNFFRLSYNELNAKKKLTKKNSFKCTFVFNKNGISVQEKVESLNINNSTYIWIASIFSILIILALIVIKLRK